MMMIYEPSSTQWVAASNVSIDPLYKMALLQPRGFLHSVTVNIMAGISTFDLHSIHANFKLETGLLLTKRLFHFI